MSEGDGNSRWWAVARHAVAVVLLVACGLILWTSERGRSLTADEPLHMVRGQVWLWKGTARLSYAHPPLANVLTALPHAGKGDEPWGVDRRVTGAPDVDHRLLRRMKRRGLEHIPPETPRAEAMEKLWEWPNADPLRISQHYFTHDFERARAELTQSRQAMMVIALAFGAFFYGWIHRRYGWTTAIVSLGLYTLHPTLLAHSRLVTTDIPAMATVFLSLTATIAWIERPRWWRVPLFLLATSAMVLTKHSGLVFVVVLSGLILVAAALGLGGFAPAGWADEPAGKARRRARLRGGGKRFALALAQLVFVAVAMTALIDAAYFFDRVGLSMTEIIAEPEPHNWLYRRYRGQLAERSFLAVLPEPLRLPFPYTWLIGLATVSKQNASGHGGYFFGLNDYSSHPLYFPVMLIVKTPLGVIGLLGISGALAWKRIRDGEGLSVATGVLLAFAAVNLVSLVLSHINIGVRHALTLMPIMILFAGRAGGLLLTEGREKLPRLLRHRWVGATLVGGSLLGGVVGTGAAFPYYLGYFNVLAGGPGGGRWISVIGEDWGQDLADVAEIAHEEGWTRIAYYTPFPLRREELESHGLEVVKARCKHPPRAEDPLIIHAADWVRRTKCFDWLEGREAAYFVNYNVFVFSPVTEPEASDVETPTAVAPTAARPQ